MRLADFYIAGLNVKTDDPNRCDLEKAIALRAVQGQHFGAIQDAVDRFGENASQNLNLPIRVTPTSSDAYFPAPTSSCPHCGNRVSPDADFCGFCGKQLNAVASQLIDGGLSRGRCGTRNHPNATRCDFCETSRLSNATFCSHCGARLLFY